MYEWTFGITDSDPASWKSVEPQWEDEGLTASSSHSFKDVMVELCATAIKNRREYDHGADEHLWNMKIVSLGDAMNPRAAEERLERLLDRDSDDDESEDGSDDGDEEKYRGSVTIQCPAEEAAGGYEDFDDPEAQVLTASTKLSKSLLPEGFVIVITYDYGTTTTLYLKVLSVKAKAVQSLLKYFAFEADSSKMMEDLKAVPAYSLPKEKQVDSYFPFASKALLGYYVPIFAGASDGRDIGENRKVMGSITMGLSAKISSEEDTVYCTMEDRTESNDLLFSPAYIDPNELLQVIDKAWEPRDRSNDPDGLDRYRYDWIRRWVVAADNDHEFDRITETIENDPGFGAKHVLFRLDRERKQPGFDFGAAFPKTYAMLRCGKFRWFQYKKDVLRVIVGRGVGQDLRKFESKQVLRTWKHDFTTLHELLCAVESSWMYEGKELTADAVLPEFDTDLRPSRPMPKEPPCYGKEKDAIVVSSCTDKKKLVTALAIAEEADGTTVLYSGHDDGTLSKWSLENNEEIWSKRVYADGTKDYERYLGCGLHVRETPGVAGIVVRPMKGSKTKSVVYTWTHAYEGYPEVERFDDRGASKLKMWSGETGQFLREYVCDIGADEEGKDAHPSISTVVFSTVYYEEYSRAFECVIIGLHCCCNTLSYDETYSEFDLEEAQGFSEGNIVPFLVSGRKMESWRGQGGMIRAMAVAGSTTKYLVSFSIRMGHGLPDSAVVWSLEEAGVPLYRKDFWNPHQRNVLKQQQTRMREIAGISVDGKKMLLADQYADRIVAFTLDEDDEGNPRLDLDGFASIGSKFYDDEGFHGRMAMSSKHAVLAMEIDPTAWIFSVSESSDHSSLDKRDGNRKEFDDEFRHGGDDYECLKAKRAARGISVGKVMFPKWGGNKPTRKKKKLSFMESLRCDDDKDGLGKGGPVQLAMRGRYVVAGFANGSLAKVELPQEFEEGETKSMSSNHIASCGTLPSDEWHVPILECDDDEDEDDQSRPEPCVIS